MNWRKATIQQLQEIGYVDLEAHPVYRQEAQTELKRRLRQRWSRVNYKMKKVYPR
ncbi:hypothetical protein [Paenibacillus sp. P46E]|uniref:hypothetical protein n=1 Tax=Paenibacillus sp. P46E TaxID=1349436 RepID=UPI000A57158D|nr:hypothetical protein [Paenibacillus sp. P46E]